MSFLKKKLSVKKPFRKLTMSSTDTASTTTSTETASTYSTSSSSSPDKTAHKLKKSQHQSTEEQEKEKEKEESNEYPHSDTDVSVDQRDTALLPDIKKNPLDEIAVTAAGLGIMFGCAAASIPFTKCKSVGLFIGSLAVFHFLEFYITAKYNPKKVHKESFIINNGSAYTLAHTFALFEFSIEYLLFPSFKSKYFWLRTTGALLIVFGQIIRTLAMKTAGQSFSHLVVTKQERDHKLVTTGIYSAVRHPSYFGFFWWAIGTQLVLLNPLGLIGFITILWLFFNERIRHEEQFLIKFFGEDYVKYRNSTPTYIPFI